MMMCGMLWPPGSGGGGSGGGSGGGGGCAGTTSCTYYDKKCKDRTVGCRDYYCFVGKTACALFGNSAWDNCMRLCLQINDTCSSLGCRALFGCQAILHANCAYNCSLECPVWSLPGP